jgi:hypothetical protein
VVLALLDGLEPSDVIDPLRPSEMTGVGVIRQVMGIALDPSGTTGFGICDHPVEKSRRKAMPPKGRSDHET